MTSDYYAGGSVVLKLSLLLRKCKSLPCFPLRYQASWTAEEAGEGGDERKRRIRKGSILGLFYVDDGSVN